MGNQILGKRSRSFYKGFNERQLNYIHEKFETLSVKGTLDRKLFMDSYRLDEHLCEKFFTEIDFTEDKNVDEYEFVCAVHSLCSSTVQELGNLLFMMCTRTGGDMTEKNLLHFTSMCLSYNTYLEKKKININEIGKANRNKFQKYDYDHNKKIDREEFIKICLKD